MSSRVGGPSEEIKILIKALSKRGVDARVKYKDREETPIAGDAYYIGPGHVPTYVESGTEFFEFSPKEKMDEVGQSLLKK